MKYEIFLIHITKDAKDVRRGGLQPLSLKNSFPDSYKHLLLTTNRPEVFCEKTILRKTPILEYLLIKLHTATYSPTVRNFFRKIHQSSCFPVNFVKHLVKVQ